MVPQQQLFRTRILAGMLPVIATLTTLVLSLPTQAFAQSLNDYDVDPTTGYRMERYRAPVPQDIPDGTTLDSTSLNALQKSSSKTVLIDVFPPVGLGPDPLEGHWITNDKRESLPGAVWLPEVGRGHLEIDAIDYFKRNLARLSHNDKSAPLVFFCTADCWQSWNAARRAMSFGYTSVYWLPLGTDGWLDDGHSLVEVQPVNFLDDSTPASTQTQTSTEAPTGFWPDTARIYLINQSGEELDIGQVSFSEPGKHSTGVDVELDSDLLIDQFLSMRPFRCLTADSEWLCYLPYPYDLARTITPMDLTELEYQLLFIWKSPKSFGIDAWNGIYYRLTLQDDGTIIGNLLQGDLNVLADPPEKFSHPIDLFEFTEEGADNRLYPSLIIRPIRP